MSDFLEFKECQGCGELFPIRSIYARKAKWCSGRCRKHMLYSGECVECGAPTYNGTVPAPEQCARCARDRINAMQASRAAAINAEVAAFRRQGYLNHEIAAALGLTAQGVATRVLRMRRAGVEVAPTAYGPTLARTAA